MATVTENRRSNLRRLLGPEKGAQRELATLLDVEPAYVSQLATGGRGIGHKTARRIEKVRGLPEGWMDQQHEDAAFPTGRSEAQLLAMYKQLSTDGKLRVLEEVQATYLAEKSATYPTTTVFEEDARERSQPARAPKKRQRAGAGS